MKSLQQHISETLSHNKCVNEWKISSDNTKSIKTLGKKGKCLGILFCSKEHISRKHAEIKILNYINKNNNIIIHYSDVDIPYSINEHGYFVYEKYAPVEKYVLLFSIEAKNFLNDVLNIIDKHELFIKINSKKYNGIDSTYELRHYSNYHGYSINYRKSEINKMIERLNKEI